MRTARETWRLTWQLVRASRIDPIRRGSKPACLYRILAFWIAWVPEVLEMLCEWEAEQFARHEMEDAPMRRDKEGDYAFKKREASWRGRLKALTREWLGEIKERMVGYRVAEKFKGWWLMQIYRRPDMADVWKISHKASAALGWREGQRYFVHDRDLANARTKWASKDDTGARWKKYGNMPAERKYWPPSVQIHYAKTVDEVRELGERRKAEWNKAPMAVEAPRKEGRG